MELKTTTKHIRSMETVYDDFKELAVDCDFVLPDYLPDIAAVLKCVMKPLVQNYQAIGDRVNAEGVVSLQLLYLDEDRKCVRSFETLQPFSCFFTVKELENNDAVFLTAKTNYVNCRATSPRRVDVHGAFNVELLVKGDREYPVLDFVDCDDVYTKDNIVQYSRRIAFEEKSFTVSEVVELMNSQGAEMLIRTCAVPRVTDCKLLPGKAIVKGEILLKSVYATDTVAGTLDCSENTILFSQIVDLDGVNEENQCVCRVSLKQCEVHPTQNTGGENKLLSFMGKLTLTLQAFCNENVTVINDAYHTRFPLQMVKKPLEIASLVDVLQEAQNVSFSMDIPDSDITSIVDLWCDINGIAQKEGAESLSADLQVLVCMLARDSRGCIVYYERPATAEIPFSKAVSQKSIQADVIKTDWEFSNKVIHLHIAVNFQGECLKKQETDAICEISVGEANPYLSDECMSDCCMKVYFAAAGESVWEIAKMQHVSPTELCAENDIVDSALTEDRMLLLPLK